MISKFTLSSALMAFSTFVMAQDAASTSIAAAPTVLPAGGLPNCVPLCMQIKFGEADILAPACDVNDLFCLCTHSSFVTALRQCLFDNCADTSESTLGRQTFAQICADSGASLLTYSAVQDQTAATEAVQEVASVLALSASANAAIPTPSFDQNSAFAYVASNYNQQVQQAQSTAAAGLSQAQALASASLKQEAAGLSQSFAAIQQQASQMEESLQTQLSGSDLVAAQSQISATLSMMKVAASQKLDGDMQAVQASLASQSNAIFNPSPSATPTQVVKAASSAGTTTHLAPGLLAIALIAFLFL